MASLPISAKLQPWKESKARFWPTLVLEKKLSRISLASFSVKLLKVSRRRKISR